MKNVQKIDLGLTGYDELFANDEERKVNKLPRIFDIPISEIDDFPDHPFKVKIDEDMDQLVQSIKERGIITPVTLRPKEDGRYEIVSGHRRKKACELAGLDTVKAEVREMSRDEAIILMVESNLQRSTILPSEKAFSYKMRLEAMKRQAGRPAQDNYSPVGNNSLGTKSSEIMADEVGESRNTMAFTELMIRLLLLRCLSLAMWAGSPTGAGTGSAPELSGAPALYRGALISAVISKPALFPNTQDASTASTGSRTVASGQITISNRHPV